MTDNYNMTVNDLAFIAGHTCVQLELSNLIEYVSELKDYPQTSEEMRDIFNEIISVHERFTKVSNEQCKELLDSRLNNNKPSKTLIY